MFLSKLFSIFKRKKNNQPNNVPPANPPTTGTVGAAVGLSQPNQAVTPDSNQVAQASPSQPDFPKPDIEAAADTSAPEPTPVTPPVDIIPSDNSTENPQPPVDEPLVTPPTPETPTTPPQEAPSEPPVSDDSENISV